MHNSTESKLIYVVSVLIPLRINQTEVKKKMNIKMVSDWMELDQMRNDSAKQNLDLWPKDKCFVTHRHTKIERSVYVRL